jgi:two-component system phosphate regulon response regulator PhoB
MKSKILVVDDEPDALELIKFNLKREGFEVLTASDGSEALRLARTQLPDLVVLDLMLPEIDGLAVCKALRSQPETAGLPVIMLTAKAAEIDRVLGLELGADDYVTKPFSLRELVLRIRNLLGRRRPADSPSETIKVGAIVIDLSRHEVKVKGKQVELTATEFKLLTLLATRRGRVQSRDRLLHDVWEYDATIDTRTVDTHVRRLREKLGPAADTLETVRGVGYRLTED